MGLPSRRNESGQGILEYILMLAVAVSVFGVLANGFKNIVLGTWQKMACEVAAPCPGCRPPESVDNKLATTCRH